LTTSRYLDIVILMKEVNLFKALADETRLRLVNLALNYELNVNEIVSTLKMGQSRISRHLKILTDSSILSSRKDGLMSFYAASKEGTGREFLDRVEYLLHKEPVFKSDLDEAGKVMNERSMETERFFDSIAEDWEKLKKEILGDLDINELIMQHIPSRGTLVDLGCGTGDLLVSLANKGEKVIGVEKSSRMLAEARLRFHGQDQKIDLRIGELEHLPLGDGEADLAVTSMVLHHLPEPQKALAEINRILKKESLFVIVDLESHDLEKMRERFGDRWLGFKKEDIHTWLEEAGFQIKTFEHFTLKKGLQGFMAISIKNRKKN